MAKKRRKDPALKAAGHLLIIACSDKKRGQAGMHPALELYNGGMYEVLRKFVNENGWPPGLVIKIISAKYGLLDASDLIEVYDKRLDKASAAKMQPRVIAALKKLGRFKQVFVNLGKDYLPAIQGVEEVFGSQRVQYAKGAIGLKKKAMKEWLHSLTNETAKVRGHDEQRPYLYFFPDWDDYISMPFCRHGTQTERKDRKYAHEIFGDKTPYDGVLVSLAQLNTGKGALSRFDKTDIPQGGLRDQMRIPERLLLFGDCGAFSYVFDDKPPFSATEAARLYDAFGFDIGASVDHIPLPDACPNPGDQERRVALTKENAQEFIAAHRKNGYAFTPMGVVQGLGVKSYVQCLNEYIDMGYRHVALGGLVPRHDSDILNICAAVRTAVQDRTRNKAQNVWIHLFGILRPKLQTYFRTLGMSSFDSASYLRKAWLRSDQNYLAPNAQRWYSTIRVPISSSTRMQEAAKAEKISGKKLAKLEQRCLTAIHAFKGGKKTRQEVIDAVNEYGPLLIRKGEDNHFVQKHTDVLIDQPWKKCRCPLCKDIGIDIVVFRGSGRNKRRGLHNTWVFYHKILHGKGTPSKARASDP
jgi:hypothetical protein